MPRDIWTPASGQTSSNPYFVLPDGWNTVWAAAKAAAGSTPAWITILGDSISISQNASVQSKGWQEIMQAALAASSGLGIYADYLPAYGMSTIGYAPGSGYFWSGILNSLTPQVNNVRTNGSGWHRTYEVGAGSTAVYHQRFTVPYACSSLDLISSDVLAGSWKYSLNAAADVTVNSGSTGIVRRTTIAGPIAINSTLDIGKQSGAGVLTLMGVVCYKSAAGIGLGRLAGQSQQLNDWLEPGSTLYPVNHVGVFSGRSDGGGGVLGANSGLSFTWGFPTQPHLAIIELGVNDCFAAGSQANYQITLDRLITALRHGRRNCSILILIPAYPEGEFTDAGIINPPTQTPAVATGSGTLTAGSTYQYALAYGSIYGDTTIGPATAGQTGQTGYNLTFAAQSGVDHISIYRNVAAGTFTLIAQVSGATTSYNDTGAAAGANANATNLSPITNWANWRIFVEFLREAARQYNCGLLNIHAKWGADPFAQGFMAASPNVHPIDAGFADIGNTIAAIL